LLPETPPVPVSATFNSGAGTGTVTFDKALDQTVVLDEDDWLRGLGIARREVGGISYQSPTVIAFTGVVGNIFIGLIVGWKYTPGVAPIKGINGVEVVAFEGVA